METLFLTLSLLRNLIFNSPVNSQEISLEPYCKNGYYEIPNEKVCSRAPGCGGYDYDSLNKSDKMPNAQDCMGDGASGRAQKGCAGYVPLCCYEVARTGDFTKCIGYWERLWCTKSQCDTAKTKGASDSQCGGSCQCGHAFDSYCGAKQPVPLSQRLQGGGGGGNPTATSVPATSAPNPTSAPTANCPSSSTRSYDVISVNNVGDNRPAANHADKNIQLRGYKGTTGTRNLIHNNGPKDDKAPQLSTVLANNKPAIVSLYQVYDWNWGSGGNGSKGSPLISPWEVTMIGLSANAGDEVRVPDSGYGIGNGFEATVLYASNDTITIKYTREDSISGGYAIQYDGICVDPNLVSKYNQLNSQGRGSLPALKGKQVIGTAKTNEVKVAVRDTGTYMDPRSDDSWWIGLTSLPNAPGITSAPPTTAPTNGPTSAPGVPTATPKPGTPTSAAATPQPGTCSKPAMPVVTSPTNAGALPGKVKVVWKSAPGTKTYAMRIDDMSNGWKGDCSVSQNPGDLCVDNIAGSSTSYEFTGVAGHTYYIWLHSINYCGEWSEAWQYIVTTPPVNAAGTCRIQGYRTLVGPQSVWKYGTWMDKNNPQYSHTLWVPEALRTVPVSVTGGTVLGNVQENPYFISVAGNQTYTVTIQPVSGYNISSTYCVNSTACHGDIGTSQTLQNGNTRTVTCPADGYADLWWLFFPSTVPTMSVPRPTATPGGSPSPTVPAATATIIYPTATPSPCPAIGQLAWRDGIPHYTRTVSSYTLTESVEVIALHLKQILQSGLVVEVSTDNGVTWMPSDSAQDDDHLVTVKNMHGKDVSIQVRLKNSCAAVSPSLSEIVPPVPMPSLERTLTPPISITPSSPISTELVIGGTLLIGLIIAAFFIGA